MAMDDVRLLEGLRRQDIRILEKVIDQYCPYVSVVIRNQLGIGCLEQDVEELASEVFYTLWQKRASVRTGNLRGWLAVVAKNKARSFQRRHRNSPQTIDLDDMIIVSQDQTVHLLEKSEQARLLALALQELGEPDSRIFSMYYYEEQSISSIAAKLSLHPEAVKSKLRRGREKLKQILLKEGYTV